MYKIFFTEPAERDITEAICYIVEELQNPVAAIKLFEDIERSVGSLQENPKRYPLVRDDYLASKGFRLMPVQKYLIFYVVRDDARDEKKSVTIERVLYNRRNWIVIFCP